MHKITDAEKQLVKQCMSTRGKNKGGLLKSKPTSKGPEIEYLWAALASMLRPYQGFKMGTLLFTTLDNGRREQLLNLADRVTDNIIEQVKKARGQV